MIYDLTEKRPKESLVVIPWESNSKTFPIILKELKKKYKWSTPEKALIYRWWKKEEKKAEFEKYGDAAVLEAFVKCGFDFNKFFDRRYYKDMQDKKED